MSLNDLEHKMTHSYSEEVSSINLFLSWIKTLSDEDFKLIYDYTTLFMTKDSSEDITDEDFNFMLMAVKFTNMCKNISSGEISNGYIVLRLLTGCESLRRKGVINIVYDKEINNINDLFEVLISKEGLFNGSDVVMKNIVNKIMED
jgi:hypothetical protein